MALSPCVVRVQIETLPIVPTASASINPRHISRAVAALGRRYSGLHVFSRPVCKPRRRGLKASEPNEQMQRDADKGIKTRNSGASGYVAERILPANREGSRPPVRVARPGHRNRGVLMRPPTEWPLSTAPSNGFFFHCARASHSMRALKRAPICHEKTGDAPGRYGRLSQPCCTIGRAHGGISWVLFLPGRGCQGMSERA